MSTTRVFSTKWDGSVHRDSEAIELGEDEHGSWFWMEDGTPVTTARGTYLARPGVRLFPPDSWWSAYFVPAHAPSDRLQQWYVDVTTPTTVR